MIWTICLYLAIGTILIGLSGVFLSSRRSRTGRWRISSPINIMVATVFISLVYLFLPVFYERFSGEKFIGVKTILISIQNTIAVFGVDGDYELIYGALEQSGQAHLASHFLQNMYTLIAASLYVIAPILTISFVLSFFRDVSATRQLLLGRYKKKYIFSELNERSLVLAKSWREKDKKALIIFADVFEQNTEPSYELVQEALKIKAVALKKDILNIYFLNKPKADTKFYIMGNEEEENVDQTLKLLKRHEKNPHVKIFLFSTTKASEILIDNAIRQSDSENENEELSLGIRVYRINEVSALIQNELKKGEYLKNVVEYKDKKVISILVVGIGDYGSELIKALCWYCQMPKYFLEIHAFDKDMAAIEKFKSAYSGLIQNNNNQDEEKGPVYSLNFYNMDMESPEFVDKIEEIKDVTHMFISLGDDEENIEAAIHARMLLLRRDGNGSLVIKTIVKSSIKEKIVFVEEQGHKTRKTYVIEPTGSIKEQYRNELILDPILEEEGYNRHLSYYKSASDHELTEKEEKIAKKAFYNNEYNYRSSISGALHKRARVMLKIGGAEKLINERTETEKAVLRPLEHRRWMAYMWGEGYVYGERNKVARQHPDLVSYGELSEDSKKKDDD